MLGLRRLSEISPSRAFLTTATSFFSTHRTLAMKSDENMSHHSQILLRTTTLGLRNLQTQSQNLEELAKKLETIENKLNANSKKLDELQEKSQEQQKLLATLQSTQKKIKIPRPHFFYGAA